MEFSRNFFLSERDVESKFIIKYLLPELGYSDKLWYQQFRHKLGIIADFAVFAEVNHVLRKHPPCLIIEAKSPKQDINNYIYQLKRYVLAFRADFGLITNGREVRIYACRQRSESIELVFQCFVLGISKKIGLLREIVGVENFKGGKYFILPKSSYVNCLKSIKSYQKVSREDFQAMKIIAIYHNKGGVGKTTVSVNLAAALANKGNRVLLVDIDSQANSTFATGLAKFQFEEDDNLKDRNISHLLASGEFDLIPDLVQKSNLFNSPEIDVIPSHISLIERQSEFTAKTQTLFRLKTKLDKVMDDYDIVIIDTPPSRDIYARIALFAADFLIIPSDLKPFANQGLENVKDFIAEVNETRSAMNREKLNIIGVLPSKILSNQRHLNYVFPLQKNTVIEKYGFPVLDSVILERISLSHCLSKTVEIGNLSIPDPKSIFEFDPQSESVKEFRNFAGEVLSKMEKP